MNWIDYEYEYIKCEENVARLIVYLGTDIVFLVLVWGIEKKNLYKQSF